MSIMYDWKVNIRGFAEDKEGHNKYQINMDLFLSSVESIEGHFHSLVFVELDTDGYIWTS